MYVNAGGRGRSAQQQSAGCSSAEEEDIFAGSSLLEYCYSNDEEAWEPRTLVPDICTKLRLRRSARVDSDADHSAAQAEGSLAEMGSGDDADLDWEDA